MIAQSHPMQAAPAAAPPPGSAPDDVDVNTIARVLMELASRSRRWAICCVRT